MSYPDMKDYITLLFFLLDEFLESRETPISTRTYAIMFDIDIQKH